jgi:hypothetical protein
MKPIKRLVEQETILTVQEVAELFCGMDDGQQAQFFNSVATITEQWENPFCFQACAIARHRRLTYAGREIMVALSDGG